MAACICMHRRSLRSIFKISPRSKQQISPNFPSPDFGKFLHFSNYFAVGCLHVFHSGRRQVFLSRRCLWNKKNCCGFFPWRLDSPPILFREKSVKKITLHAEAFSLFDKHCHQNAAEDFFGGKPSAKVWLKEGERDWTHQRRSGKYKHALGTEGVRSSALGNKGAHMWIPSRVCSAVERHKNRLADVNTHKQDWRERLSICAVTNSAPLDGNGLESSLLRPATHVKVIGIIEGSP